MQKQLPQFITSSSQQQQRDVMMGDSVEAGVGQWYPGGQNNGSGGGGVVAIAGTGANGGGGGMLNMLNMYTSTVLKILQQAVEEIKRGMVLIKQQQQLQLELQKQGGGNSNKQQQQQVVLSNNINQIQRQKLQASIAYTRTVTSANNSKGIGIWNSVFLFSKIILKGSSWK
jgi:hypothetical protein